MLVIFSVSGMYFHLLSMERSAQEAILKFLAMCSLESNFDWNLQNATVNGLTKSVYLELSFPLVFEQSRTWYNQFGVESMHQSFWIKLLTEINLKKWHWSSGNSTFISSLKDIQIGWSVEKHSEKHTNSPVL